MKTISVTINGKKLQVPENYTIIEAAKEIGIDIPALCYDPNLDKVGACRICVVEVEGARNLMAACTTPITEGMVISTESKNAVETRKEILRLLLDNHPNDCLVCNKAGECKLQEYAFKYDVKFRQHDGERRQAKVDNTNPYIHRDDSKCVLCGKCVRTCNKVEDRKVLSFGERGFETHIVADYDNLMADSSCVSCARCLAVCPVGALMDARTMGKARVWETTTEDVKCTVCEYGCDFELLKKNGKVYAVRAKSPVEGRPLCLKGRLSVDLTYNEEVQVPYVKKDGKFVEATWEEALGLGKLLSKLGK